MDRLWAPWRMTYIESPKKPVAGCVFCLAPDSADDSERQVLVRGDCCFAMLNRYPYNNGHLMVVPYEHASRLSEVSPEAQAEMMRMATGWTEVLADLMKAEGFNLGLNLGAAAGAGIKDHLHLHIVPRWHGDTNFMPVVGQTKVMPEELSVTWQRLRAAWRTRFGAADG
ncbi:MAG: HIT domain-containing protein [Armatimonadetes bacterium]|nr:HIT domain-containing protein [Armatimonadota bacterium]